MYYRRSTYKRMEPRGEARRLQVGQPALVLPLAPGHDVEECRLEHRRQRTARAGPDLAAVDLADRRDLRRGAGEEDLVRDVELVARDRALLDLNALVARDLEDRVAGDTAEHAVEARRRDDAIA